MSVNLHISQSNTQEPSTALQTICNGMNYIQFPLGKIEEIALHLLRKLRILGNAFQRRVGALSIFSVLKFINSCVSDYL